MNSWPTALLIGICVMAPACSEEKDPKEWRTYGDIPELKQQATPSTARSRQVIERVAPALIGDLKEAKLEFGAPVFIRIFKEEAILELWMKGEEHYQLFRSYQVAGMSGRLGPKLKEGDRQAPEGFYFVTPSQMNPKSDFHLSFNLGYPNAYDNAHGRTGSALMVHGGRLSLGCYAMTNAKIEEIYTLCDAALRNGQAFFRVHCFPFRMSAENMEKHKDSKWADFWLNLKTGHDWFEEHKLPPNVTVEEKRYVFEAED